MSSYIEMVSIVQLSLVDTRKSTVWSFPDLVAVTNIKYKANYADVLRSSKVD